MSRAVAVARVHGRLAPARHERVLRALAATLPRVGVLDEGAFACDLRGTERLLGAPLLVGRRIAATCDALGHPASVGIARGPFVARIVAERIAPGTVRHVVPADEPAFLAPLPLETLPLDRAQREECALLGIRDVGAFLALDRGAVLDRFGRAAAYAHGLARGDEQDAGLVPAVPPRRRILARRSWDDPLDSRERLVFALRTALDEIAVALAREGLGAVRLALRLERERAAPLRLERLVLPPTADAAALLRSLRWALDERPEIGRVVGASVEVTEAEPARGRQLGLFAPDGARAEEAIALARYLRGRLGPAAVLRAEVVDPDARLPEREARWEEVVS
ncbi:MAG TPA: hypothetical protein VMJ92_04725 [Candidatus Limnocylindrales bacterium]|nr:hypothetical protein [Candidatus Limnocylindrales bacterium]